MSRQAAGRNKANDKCLPPLPKLRPRPGLKPPVRFPPKDIVSNTKSCYSAAVSIRTSTESETSFSPNNGTSTAVPVNTFSSLGSLEGTKTCSASKSSILNSTRTFGIHSQPIIPTTTISENCLDHNAINKPKMSFNQSLSVCPLITASSANEYNFVTSDPIGLSSTVTRIDPIFTTLLCPPPMLGSKNVQQNLKDNDDNCKNNCINQLSNKTFTFTEYKKADFEDGGDGKTSRLLMKTDCKGGRGGRKRNGDGNTSLVHSIPKFSEVVPKGGKISEVQKVLQTRLLSRRKEKLQTHSNNGSTLDKQKFSSDIVLDADALPTSSNTRSQYQTIFMDNPSADHIPVSNCDPLEQMRIRTINKSAAKLEGNKKIKSIDLKATNILQNMITLHEQQSGSLPRSNNEKNEQNGHISREQHNDFRIRTPASLLSMQNTNSPKVSNLILNRSENYGREIIRETADTLSVSHGISLNSSNRRKSRKPNKHEICHVVQNNNIDRKEKDATFLITQTNDKVKDGDKSNTTNAKRCAVMEENTVHLSPEVTITPTKMVVQRDDIKVPTTHMPLNYDGVLNLSKGQTEPSLSNNDYTKHLINQKEGEKLRRSTSSCFQTQTKEETRQETKSHPPPILSPEQYEARGLPSGYIYWPSGNVFVHPSTIPEHFLCDSSLKDNQMQADQLQLIREEKHSNNNSKYRRILPKESHPCVLQSSEKTIRQQPKATATSTSYPHEKISQFTRYSKISDKVVF